ncbi:MAG: hypothetical protein NTV80_25100 [Verrucomicrobia bacterium]|nr:hypothetical protein [Verrucomicrobiota bacterium]
MPTGLPANVLGQKTQATPIKIEANSIGKDLLKNSDFQNGLDHGTKLDPSEQLQANPLKSDG